MGSIIRIIVGAVILAAGFFARGKAAPAISAAEGAETSVGVWNVDTSPLVVNLIVWAALVVGAALIVFGLAGFLRKSS